MKSPDDRVYIPKTIKMNRLGGSSQPLFLSAASLAGLWDPQPCLGIHRDSDEALHLYWTVTTSEKGAGIKAVCYLPCVSAQAPDL